MEMMMKVEKKEEEKNCGDDDGEKVGKGEL